MQPFRDRNQGGRVLAQKLSHYRDHSDAVVLALPRGGVPVGYQVARALNAPLDVFIVRKLGVPGHEEYAMGAIASGGITVMNPDAARVPIPQSAIDEIVNREQHELQRRERLYRGNRAPIDIAARIAIVVDDGLATGSSMHAAVAAIRKKNPARLVVAVPVAAPEACQDFENEADEVVCALTPQPFQAVGLWYQDFDQTRDEEVQALLEAARAREASSAP
jgi:putative phosphoribosyl transferase